MGRTLGFWSDTIFRPLPHNPIRAAFMMVIDNGHFLIYYRTIVFCIVFILAIAYTFDHPNRSLILTTAFSGAFLLTLSIDAYSSRSFGVIVFKIPSSSMHLVLNRRSRVASFGAVIL